MQTPSAHHSAEQLALLLLEQQSLSDWQIGFLAVALHESANYSPVVTNKDCISGLLQMNSGHRNSVVDVVRVLTGVKFRASVTGVAGNWKFHLVEFTAGDPINAGEFEWLTDQHGWGSDAHRSALCSQAEAVAA